MGKKKKEPDDDLDKILTLWRLNRELIKSLPVLVNGRSAQILQIHSNQDREGQEYNCGCCWVIVAWDSYVKNSSDAFCVRSCKNHPLYTKRVRIVVNGL